MSAVALKIQEKKLVLPQVTAPAANYVPYTISRGTVFVSGQLPMKDGKPQFIGKIGKEYSIEQGMECAELCALNILAHLNNACGGNLDNVKQVLRLGVFVSGAPGFNEPHKVANGASNLIADVFGDKGKHARFAVVVADLPFGVAVEVDGTFEIA
ncbi:MAG: RidA family protein [Alphaproteobacteria bacterium]|nr:RidA family protein [Alphaproteobacteria bacterium]